MRRVLVTGAGGFIGANLARRLLEAGHDLHLLLRPGAPSWRIDAIRARVTVHEADLVDEATVGDLLARIRPAWVFHLAAHGAYSSQTDAGRIVRANVLGTIHLVEAALRAGVEALVNTGSSSEYGFKDHAPSEQERLEPNSHYAVTKAAATLYCRYTARRHGLRLPTLRLYSVYGPWEEPTRLMPALIVRGLRHELPPLVNPRVARDYVYAEDVVDAYLLAATRDGEPGAVYNVGTGVQTSLEEVVAVARRVLGVTAEARWGSMPDRAWDTTVWVADSRKIRADLGWEPRHRFEDGFRRMVAWLTSDGDVERRYAAAHPGS